MFTMVKMTVQRRLKKDKAKNTRSNNTIIQQQYIKDFFFLKKTTRSGHLFRNQNSLLRMTRKSIGKKSLERPRMERKVLQQKNIGA